MTVVLVHGLPENALIWEPLQRELGSPSVAVTLPGIGGAAPVGWNGSKEALLAWLDEELAGFEPPLDVVGHDLGALLVMRLTVAGRTRFRSWVVDVPDLFAPDARFSPFAIALQQADDPHAILQQRSRQPPRARTVLVLRFCFPTRLRSSNDRDRSPHDSGPLRQNSPPLTPGWHTAPPTLRTY